MSDPVTPATDEQIKGWQSNALPDGSSTNSWCHALIARIDVEVQRAGVAEQGYSRVVGKRHEESQQHLEYFSKSRKQLAMADALLERAGNDSAVTSSDDPGCFFCDRSEGHEEDCDYAAYRAARGEQ